MIVERSVHAEWTSNTYLVADAPGGAGCMIDAGGPIAPLLDRATNDGIAISHILITHRHEDHVDELEALVARLPDVVVVADAHELMHLPVAATAWDARRSVMLGQLPIRALRTPGHTNGMLAYHVGDAVFTGDTLYRGSVGSLRSPGHTNLDDLKRSVLDVILALPRDTTIYPGHAEPTTVGDELRDNPFVRNWRGDDPSDGRPCRIEGQPARALVVARDYDGGTKVMVRWPDGTETIVPGSSVDAAEL